MKRNWIGYLAFALLLSGCQTGPQNVSVDSKIDYVDEYNKLSVDDIMTVNSIAELTINISDPDVIAGRAENIVVAKVVSILGGKNRNEKTNEYVSPYTFGEIEVIESIKGDLTVGEKYSYVRIGGIVPLNDYAAAMYPDQREKFLNNFGNNPKPMFVQSLFESDIMIESGKTYLMYMISDENQTTMVNSHAIIGFEGGLREVEQGETSKSSETKVYNNFTKQWELLSDLFE